MAGGRGTGHPRAFAAMLREFQDDGCSILVTGDAWPAVTADATGVFFGVPERDRRRVLAFGEPNRRVDVERYLPDGVPADHESVATAAYAGPSRSGAAATVEDPPDAGPSTPGGPDLDRSTASGRDALEAFQADVSRTVASVEADAGRLSPGVLRVCVLDLHDLLVAHGVTEVDAFCRAIGAQVKGHSGMAYFHVGADPPLEDLDPMLGAFDAVVELDRTWNRRDGTTLQRWHVLDHGYVTDWLPLEQPD